MCAVKLKGRMASDVERICHLWAKAKAELKRNVSEVHRLKSRNEDLEAKVDSLRDEVECLREKNSQHKLLVLDKEAEIAQLSSSATENKTLRDRNKELAEKLEHQICKNKSTDALATDLQKRLMGALADSAEQSQELHYLREATGSTQKLERCLRQSRVDCSRLLQLLGTTSEFKEFAETNFNIGEKNGPRYVPARDMRSTFDDKRKNNSLRMREKDELDKQIFCDLVQEKPDTSNLKSEVKRFQKVYGSNEPDREISPETETKYWIPSSVISSVEEFKSKFPETVPGVVELIEALLINMNHLFKRQELKKLKEIKTREKKRYRDMRRKFENNRPYAEVVETQRNKVDEDTRPKRKSKQTLQGLRNEVGRGVKSNDLEKEDVSYHAQRLKEIVSNYIAPTSLEKRQFCSGLKANQVDLVPVLESCLTTIDRLCQKQCNN